VTNDPVEAPYVPVFDPYSGIVQIDTYYPSARHRVECQFCKGTARRLPARAVYQVRSDAVYDGQWKQACPKHLSLAVTYVSGLASRDGRSQVPDHELTLDEARELEARLVEWKS
jgi:hypothetical protein